LAFDGAGNLWIADHNLEFDGNLRLLEFDADSIPDSPTSAVFGIPATRVLGREGDFSEPNCPSGRENPMCAPWEPTFDSRDRMIIGFNGYLGPRFPMVYQDPLTNPLPVAALADFHSMPLSARFDQFDNLYILDHNRMRILIYRDRQVETYQLTGTIRMATGEPITGVSVETTGYASSGLCDASGAYTLTGLITGTYEIVPTKDHYTFTPPLKTITVPTSAASLDFVGHYVPTTATIATSPAGATVSEVVTVTVDGSYDEVELYLDDGLHGADDDRPAVWSWSTHLVDNGTHVLRATPYDEAGRAGTPCSTTVTVTNPPTSDVWGLSGLQGLDVVDISAAPSDPQVLYAASRYDGVYKTIDGGVFWKRSSEGLPSSPHLYSLAISPADSRVVYLSSNWGLYKSTDGGDSWAVSEDSIRANDVAIASSNPQVVYAVEHGVHKTGDGGDSWTSSLTDIYLRSVAVDPFDALKAYAGDSSSVLYRTTDGGSSWVTRTVESSSGNIQSITIDPRDTETLYVGKLWGPGGVYQSTDGGDSWVRTGLESGVNTQSLAMAPADSRVLYAGNGWGGVYRTEDGGLSWRNVSDGLPPGLGTMALAVDPTDAGTVYAGLDDGGVWSAPHLVPSAAFTASPRTGIAPLSVAFTNTSLGDHSQSAWDFGDGDTSTQDSPTHVYQHSGSYTVSLTVSNLYGSDCITHGNYITAYEPVQADFTASPTSGVVTLTVDFTNLSAGDFDTCAWDFGDGGTSSDCSEPSHEYTSGGTYTVSLTVSGPGGSDELTRASYITACHWADVVCDCVVNVLDVQAVASRWRCQVGDGCYDARYDLDGDGVITVVGIMQVAAEWGWSCP
jgi:PKD repeat protein